MKKFFMLSAKEGMPTNIEIKGNKRISPAFFKLKIKLGYQLLTIVTKKIVLIIETINIDQAAPIAPNLFIRIKFEKTATHKESS
jgi:hypothetical protein